MADPTNPYAPDTAQTIGMMLMGLGGGISDAASRNQPIWGGIAPGVTAGASALLRNRQLAAQYDQWQKQYQLEQSYKQMQEQQLALQTEGLRRQFGFQDKILGGQLPGLRPPVAGPQMGPANLAGTPGAAQTGQDESGSNYTAVNPLSGAGGKYQFLPSTWADVATKHPELGLPFDMRQATPQQQETAKATLDRDNGQGLQASGIQPTAENLYYAHRFGVAGAKAFLSANPSMSVAQLFPPDWIKQNPDLQGVTVGQFRQGVAQRYAGAAGPQTGGLPQPPGPPPDTSGYAAWALGGPQFGQMGQAIAGNIQNQYKYGWQRYNAQLDAAKLKQQLANGDVIIDANGNPVPNPAKAQAEAAAARAKAMGTAQAKRDIYFPPDFDKLTTDQKLAALPPTVRGVVQDLGPNGDLALSDLPTRMASSGLDPSKVDVYSIAKRVWGDQFDMRQREAQKNFMTDIYQGNKPEGATRLALITGIQHLSTFASLVKAQANGDYPAMNALTKAWNEQKGNPKFSGADALMQFLAPEAAKVVKGGNQLNETEIEDNKEQLLNTKSWPQASTILQTWMGAMLARKAGLEDSARSLGVPDSKIERFWGTGPKGQPSAMTKAMQDFYAVTGGDQIHAPAAAAAPPQGVPPQTPTPIQGGQFKEGMTATNPKTGQRAVYRGGKWVVQ